MCVVDWCSSRHLRTCRRGLSGPRPAGRPCSAGCPVRPRGASARRPAQNPSLRSWRTTMSKKKALGAVTSVAIASLTLAACSGGDEDGGGDGATLTIVTNAIAGGENEAEEKWIDER